MDLAEMKAELLDLVDPSLAAYLQKVVTDTRYPMLCVAVPQVRRVAKRAAKEDFAPLLGGPFDSFELLLCTGLAVAYAKAPLAQRLDGLRKLLPHLDSWALTDCIFPTLRFAEGERQLLWDFAMECLKAREEYTVRSGIVLLLRFFLTKKDIPQVCHCLQRLQDDRYYVQMAVAWCFAEMAVTDFEIVENTLESGDLDLFIHNKTIQKIRESYRIPAEKKEAALRLRRKL